MLGLKMPIKVHFKINYISAEMCTLLCFTIQDLDISCSVVPLHRFQLAIFLSGIKILRDIDKPQSTKLLTVTVRILTEPYTNTILRGQINVS